MGKLVSTLGELQQDMGRFPTQPQANPQVTPQGRVHHLASSSGPSHEQAQAVIALRSGKAVDKAVVDPLATPIHKPSPEPSSLPTIGEFPKDAPESDKVS